MKNTEKMPSPNIRICIICCLYLHFSFASFAQKSEIRGCVVENINDSNQPVGYVNVFLMNLDSTLVAGAATNEKGIFNIQGVKNGDYLLATSFLGYEKTFVELKNFSKSIDLGNITIIPSNVTLNEVTISASNYLNRIDRKIIFPDESQVRRSSNGIDLLRNLQLNGIEIKMSDNTVTGARGGRAELRINGVKADEKEVLGINPKDVIRIEYHDEPSLRYGDAEVVVDYILRRYESGGAVAANFQKGFPLDLIDGNLNTKLNYKKSEFSLSASINHRRFKEDYRTNYEEFNFSDGRKVTRIEDGLPDTIKTDIYNFRLNYSYLEPEDYHFSISAGYYQYYNPVYKTRSLLYSKGGEEDDSTLMKEYHYSDTKTPSVNMYFQKYLKNKQLLVFDLVGTYIGTDYKRDYKEIINEEILTDIISCIDGKKYSVIGEAFYERNFDQGRLSSGIRHNQNFIKNHYSGNYNSETNMTQSSTYFYADWMGRINKYSYSAAIGGTQTHIEQGNTLFNEIRFTPSVRLGYQLNDYFQIRYRGESGIQSPSLGDLNATEQIIDSLQIRRGNPSLKPVPYYLNRLIFSFDKKLFSTSFEIFDHYSQNPIMESVFEENGKFIRMMENHKAWHQVYTSAYARVSLLDGNLNMYARGGLNRIDNWGERYTHTMNNLFINAGINYNRNKWNPYCEVVTRSKNLAGEIITYSGQAAIVGLQYRNKGITVNAYYRNSMGWQSRRDNISQFASSCITNYSPELNHIVYLRIQWNFEFGRRYNSGQKKLNNSDNDAGVMSGGK